MTITEMRVHMDCVGCETNIKKALQKLDGVDDIEIDIAMQKVTVTGWAEQKKVLRTVKKTGRRAELWAYPYINPEYYSNLNHDQQNQYYNYNYNYDYHTTQPDTYYYPTTATATETSDQQYGSSYYGPNYNYSTTGVDVQATSLFSDENPHACSIM